MVYKLYMYLLVNLSIGLSRERQLPTERAIEHVETDVLRVSWRGTDHSRLQGAAVHTRSQTLGPGKFGVPSPSSFRQSIVRHRQRCING